MVTPAQRLKISTLRVKKFLSVEVVCFIWYEYTMLRMAVMASDTTDSNKEKLKADTTCRPLEMK